MILIIRKKLAKLFFSDIFIFSDNQKKKIKELENENRKIKDLLDKSQINLNYLFDNASYENYSFLVKGINNEKIFIRLEIKENHPSTHYVSFEKLTDSNKMETILECQYRLEERIISFEPIKEIVILHLDWISCASGNESKGYGSLCMDYIFYIAKHDSISTIRGIIGSRHTSDEINRKRLLNYYKKIGFNVKMDSEYNGNFYLDFDDKGVPLKISQT